MKATHQSVSNTKAAVEALKVAEKSCREKANCHPEATSLAPDALSGIADSINGVRVPKDPLADIIIMTKGEAVHWVCRSGLSVEIRNDDMETDAGPKDPIADVVIIMKGNAVQSVSKPDGLTVEIRNYDVQDEDSPRARRDEDGDLYGCRFC